MTRQSKRFTIENTEETIIAHEMAGDVPLIT